MGAPVWSQGVGEGGRGWVEEVDEAWIGILVSVWEVAEQLERIVVGE